MSEENVVSVKRDGYKTSFEQNLTYSIPTDVEGDFIPVSYELACSEYNSYMHAVHGMIYSKGERLLWGRYKQPGDILMQMRFDGMIGFPGGLLDHDDNESPVSCLNRELLEEINLDINKYKFTDEHYALSNVNHKKKLVTHFFIHQVSPPALKEIVHSSLKANDWGHETFGIIHVPLYAMDDGERGLPVFLASQFAGNARNQLLFGIVKSGLLSQEECDVHIERYQNYIKRC